MEKKDLLANYAASKQNMCITNDTISDRLFQEYGVNRGLRDVNGKGVLTGLTRISKIVSFKDENGKQVPCDGELWYRGYNVKTLIKSIGPNEFGFEKAAYLLLFGELPDQAQLDEFCEVLGNSRTLPTNFTRDVIMKAPSKDIMNSMTRSILTLAAYDPYTTDSSIENNIRQCMQLIANFPMIAAYGYHAYNHYENDSSMYIHRPDPKLSTAENFLRMLRPNKQYTQLEAQVLDVALMLHMEHGGGNNSTFTTRVVTSAGTDTYSAIAAAMSSLKGPKHGGANIKVMQMMNDIRENVHDWSDRDEVKSYLGKMLDGQVFDKKGLIYGMGHAVYSLSDPRVLDVALMLHMEHGGGNNSTFTTRVVTSAGTDTYSAIAAAMSSLKGPKHGGANIKVMQMMNDIRENVHDWSDRDEVKSYLGKMLDGQVFDKKGLIYGMGHAVYSLSDPRERVFRSYVEHLAEAKGRQKDMNLYNMIEEVAPELIAEKRHIFKGVSPNVDFYSGFVYEMLGIPSELYTPLFAIARIAGWSAHRLEELVGCNKIIRPAYKSVMEELE